MSASLSTTRPPAKSEAVRATIRAYEKHGSLRLAAEALGVSHTTVRMRLLGAGHKLHSPGGWNPGRREKTPLDGPVYL